MLIFGRSKIKRNRQVKLCRKLIRTISVTHYHNHHHWFFRLYSFLRKDIRQFTRIKVKSTPLPPPPSTSDDNDEVSSIHITSNTAQLDNERNENSSQLMMTVYIPIFLKQPQSPATEYPLMSRTIISCRDIVKKYRNAHNGKINVHVNTHNHLFI